MTQITTPQSEHKSIGTWLLICALMVFVMVILGGLTRLTHSGLSMVEWQLTTILPPMNQAEWVVMFEKYQKFPEFNIINKHMGVEEFKGIFWLEFIHRNWGRLIGFVFLFPFIYFVARKMVDLRLGLKLAGLFALGGAQGGMGWYMVKSGLVDNPDVSQYRLTAHLMLATFILLGLVWVGANLRNRPEDRPDPDAAQTLNKRTLGIIILILITITSGGFVAGTDAGFVYNDFPFMGGDIVPEGYLGEDGFSLLSIFNETGTIQFNHRVLAITTVGLTIALWLSMRTTALARRTRQALNLSALMAIIQLGLGISTLMLAVPISLGSMHQGGALVLLALMTWLLSETRGRSDKA